MSVLTRRPSLRWIVPAVAAVVLAAAGSTVGALNAAARSGLPDRSAAQLLVDVQKARVEGLSGTIVQNADLGLPSLPGVGGSGSSDLTSLVAGSHTLRLWYAGPSRVRVALLGSLGESDVVRNGTDLWTWSSATKSATHRTLPKADGAPRDLASASPVTPQQAADAALKAIGPSTTVRPDGTAVVARRSAYELVLRPRDKRSLVDSVRIAIDGKTHVPLRVQVFGANADKPAFEVGFTSFDPTTPADSVFAFNPPPGTKVTDGSTAPSLTHGTKPQLPKGAKQAPDVVGTGWTSVVVVKAPQLPSGGASLNQLLDKLPKVSGSWGSGRLLRGTVFSALLTDDGRLAVGAVAPSLLTDALASR